MTKLNAPLAGVKPALKTLADVLLSVDGIAGLSKGRRCDLKTAVRRMAKVVGQEPLDVPVNLSLFQAKLDGFVPADHGITPKRWSSIKSDFQGALRLTGLAEPLRTSAATVLPAWVSALGLLDHESHRLGLSRFARFCSLVGIEPDGVTEAAMVQFGDALKGASLVRNPTAVHRKTGFVWNEACRLQGFPGQPVTIPSYRPVAKRAAVPEALLADAEAYLAWCAVGSHSLDDDARVRPLKATTITCRRQHIIAASVAALEAGIPAERLFRLADLLEPEIFKAILLRRHQACGAEPNAFLEGLAKTLTILAREWVKVGPEQLARLKALARKLPPLKPGLTQKNTRLLDRFENPGMLDGFLRLPGQLWKEARSGKLSPKQAMVRAQVALSIELAINLGLRLTNLTNLSFERHLGWPAGPTRPALLRIPADEMKGGEEHIAEVPADLARMLQEYRNRIAPRVLGRKPDRVFVTVDGGEKSSATIAVQFETTVRKRLGLRMTMHQIRHLCAKLILDDNPGAYETARQFLAHRNLKTTINFYAGSDTRRAARHHQEIIRRTREASPAFEKRRRSTKLGHGSGRKE